ncbi:MAG: helix-turn-helix domain-containing protein [Hyphomicrobiaceae bacterium]|nr:helix-turn-helix domain-containing protein [Hyphomicrobiaceae bacterium]
MSANATGLSTGTLLNTDESARFLTLSRPTLERMRSNGTGPAFIRLGHGRRSRIAYRIEDLEAWLNANRFQSTAEYAHRP